MTAAMLACYPEIFAGGAIIAGLPFGAAANVRDALEAMKSAPLRTPREWGDAVRAASWHAGPWPRVSIWHGGMDQTVNINNAQASVAQWADLHGLALGAARQDMRDGAVRLNWGSALEVITVPTLGHGVPIAARDLGAPAPFILEAGISSTRRIAEFFGLMQDAKARAKPAAPQPQKPTLAEIEAVLMPHEPPPLEAPAENLVMRVLRRLFGAKGR
jgi:poly(3-hydroxybutyrate) depolymerase